MEGDPALSLHLTNRMVSPRRILWQGRVEGTARYLPYNFHIFV